MNDVSFLCVSPFGGDRSRHNIVKAEASTATLTHAVSWIPLRVLNALNISFGFTEN